MYDNKTISKWLSEILKEKYQCSIELLRVPSRVPRLVRLKEIATVILRHKGISYPDIAEILNYKDHTSVMHLYANAKNSGIIQDITDYIDKISISDKTFIVNQKPTRWTRVYKEKGYKCQVCGFDDFVEIHHLVHRQDGGSDDISNLVVLCPNHHTMIHQGLLHIKPSSLSNAQK